MSSLVRVLTNTGKSVKHFTVDALTGKYYERLLRVPGIKNLEVSDPDLEANLTEDELRRMREKFPYLAPKERKPEPLPLGENVVLGVDLNTVPKETAQFIEAISQITVEDFEAAISKLDATGTEEQPQAAKRGRKPKQA